MTDTNGWRTGHRTTPREAVREVVPDRDTDHVAWISGLEAIPDREDPPKFGESTRVAVTVIYEDRAPKQWRIAVNAAKDGWKATFIGAKKV